ncbi:hypothetical protein PIB30_005670 [Stylosanthes scabra]|uniref:Uncharacterized protein n=1 Tax=Stylosanthes scabra TaxID=79078 RepID=A0ABU6U2Z1_9FABA|nr:hypothetical protein [Stylosanthes scabra]
MGYSSSIFHSFVVAVIVAVFVVNVGNGQLVPALFIFGDSVVDVGNNNHRLTLVKANFPPYGRDFENHYPTGRFCNGKLATDFIVDILGFNSYPPAYMDLQAKGNNLLNGANFASAASGYLDHTAIIYDAVPLSHQLECYKDCQNKLVEIAGQAKAASIISDAIYLVNSGSSDFIQNFYINPLLNKLYTADKFSDLLLQCYSNFIQNLHALGARRIGVTTLPPMGCLPASITLFNPHGNECVSKFNSDAINFNAKLNATSEKLRQMLPGLNLVTLDIYQPLYDLISNPQDYGFSEARKGCCGTGLVETAILCNKKSIGTCANASEYVFWDGVHPSEAANQVLANNLLAAGASLIS